MGPDFEPPDPPETQSYTESKLPGKTESTQNPGGEAQVFALGKEIPACWWYLFHSKPLNELIEHAFKNSPTLETAQAALRQAQENLNVSVGSLFPFVSVQSQAQRQKFSPSIFGVTNPPTKFNLYNAAGSVSYTLDLFGGIRRQVESSEALVEQQCFLLEATYLTLTSNIVTSAITEASLREQLQATQELISLQEKRLEITEKKFKLGGASQLDVLAQQTQLAQTRTALPPLQTSLANTRSALSVLIGELPSESHLPTFRLSDLQLPEELPLSLPSSLVRQRPDIRSAEAFLHSESAQIGVATANFFPNITITGNYGWTANKIGDLFESQSSTWSILGNLLQPIFQGGTLVAKREAAIASFEQAFAQYRESVLQGFQNVADTLHALQNDAQQLQIQTEAENSAQDTLALTETQYKVGAVNYLNLIDAQTRYLQARIGRIQALAARYTDTAALFQALGGGWWNRKPIFDQPDQLKGLLTKGKQ